MIHLNEMRKDVEMHLEEIKSKTSEEINVDIHLHLIHILEHLERMHRNLAVHLETLG